MAAVTGLTVVKKFPYRGDPNEEFSNTYHFKSLPPGDDASWEVLVSDVVNREKTCFSSNCTYVRAYGYDSDAADAHHVFAKDFAIPGPPPIGTFVAPGSGRGAGDQAACLWWKSDQLTSKGKPIYLRKYFHDIWIPALGGDSLDTTYVTALETFVSPAGIQSVHGGLRGRERDMNILAAGVIGFATTRTLKRRGKRPPLAP